MFLSISLTLRTIKLEGGIIYVHVIGRPVIIINDLGIARELMEKRGAVYSDRPPLILISQMLDQLPIPYGDLASFSIFQDGLGQGSRIQKI